MAADGIKLGGFADVGFGYNKTGSADAVKGFQVGQGAFYFGKTLGAGEVLVDLPFAYGPAIYGNSILAGFGNAQAVINWKYDNGFSWKMGQFDGAFGFEAADSIDRFFSDAGIISAALPTTHTGLGIGYKASDAMSVSFLVANPYNKGGVSNSATKFDYGFKVDTTSDAFNFSVGMLFSANTPATGVNAGVANAGDYEWTIDAVAGNKMGELSSNIEAYFHNDKVASKTGSGFGGHFDYAMNEGMDLGASVEWMKAASVAAPTTLDLRVGPKWNMSKDMNVRMAYGHSKVSTATDADTSITLNVVSKF